jgi:outer membrane protein assembly factor BamB
MTGTSGVDRVATGRRPAPSDPKAWPEKLTQKWKVEVGSGYATPLVVGNRIYQFSRQGEREVMTALDADTGKVLWQTGYDAPFTMHSATTTHGPGPKSTPAFANGRLFSIGMTGIVTAYDANSGKQVWQKPGTTPVPLYTTHAFLSGWWIADSSSFMSAVTTPGRSPRTTSTPAR